MVRLLRLLDHRRQQSIVIGRINHDHGCDQHARRSLGSLHG